MAPSAIPIAHMNGHEVEKAKMNYSAKATGGSYTKKTPEEKAKLTYKRAVNSINQNLSRMAPLKALLELDMGGDDGPLYLDARGEPKLVAFAEGTPDCQLKIKPQYIIDFADGKLEPRYGLLKGT